MTSMALINQFGRTFRRGILKIDTYSLCVILDILYRAIFPVISVISTLPYTHAAMSISYKAKLQISTNAPFISLWLFLINFPP